MRLCAGRTSSPCPRAVGITAARASHWRAQFLAAGQAGLKSRAPDARDDDHRRLQAKIGELLMETELLYAKVDQLEAGGPLARRRVDAMRAPSRFSTRRAYGVQRVCRVWHRARSSVYARRQATRSPARCRRRGPIGAAPDDVLVAHIRRVLEASPFMARATKSLGEAAGRGDAHLEGAGAPVDARARPPSPARAGHAHGPKAHDGTIPPRRPT